MWCHTYNTVYNIWFGNAIWSVCMLILLGNCILNLQIASKLSSVLDSFHVLVFVVQMAGRFFYSNNKQIISRHSSSNVSTSHLNSIFFCIIQTFNWNVITWSEILENSHAFHCLWWEVARWMNVHGLGHQCNCWTDPFFFSLISIERNFK